MLETTEAAPAKSMASLAGILREKGLEVFGFEERQGCCQPRLQFLFGLNCEFDTQDDMRDFVESLGYTVARKSRTFEYEKSHELPWTYACFEFVIQRESAASDS